MEAILSGSKDGSQDSTIRFLEAKLARLAERQSRLEEGWLSLL